MLRNQVGYGELGLNDNLGFSSGTRSKIMVSSRACKDSISMHPPHQPSAVADAASPSTSLNAGTSVDDSTTPGAAYAFAVFSTAKKYSHFSGSVTLNDSAESAELAEHDTRVIFEIWGDKSLIWRSKAVTKARQKVRRCFTCNGFAENWTSAVNRLTCLFLVSVKSNCVQWHCQAQLVLMLCGLNQRSWNALNGCVMAGTIASLQ